VSPCAVEHREARVEPIEGKPEVRSCKQHDLRAALFDHGTTGVKEGSALLVGAPCTGGHRHVGLVNVIEGRTGRRNRLDSPQRAVEPGLHDAPGPEEPDPAIAACLDGVIHHAQKVDDGQR
jgi:hypothetical protein